MSAGRKTVLILGGYGTFGKRIAERLTAHGVHVVIAGRNFSKASTLAASMPNGLATPFALDVEEGLEACLKDRRPFIVVNTCGPFQGSDYSVARACLKHNVHYIDLADGRDFVGGIYVLAEEAVARNVVVVSGASTVPALSSAVLSHLAPHFHAMEQLRYGISPGQRTARGLATTRGILTYVGKKLAPCAGHETLYGWQNLYIQNYPVIGRRLMANCDIPDLDLLPRVFGLKDIRFSAGLENSFLHLGLWAISWLVRFGVIRNVDRHAETLLQASHMFDCFGSDNGGMHVSVSGLDKDSQPLTRTWFIIARGGHGPYIPAIPAVLLCKKLLSGELAWRGAAPCVNTLTLEEYLAELSGFNIRTFESNAPPLCADA